MAPSTTFLFVCEISPEPAEPPRLVLRCVTVLGAGKPPQYFTEPPGTTQPPTLSGTENEYRPKFGDALRLENKGRYDFLLVDKRAGGR